MKDCWSVTHRKSPAPGKTQIVFSYDSTSRVLPVKCHRNDVRASCLTLAFLCLIQFLFFVHKSYKDRVTIFNENISLRLTAKAMRVPMLPFSKISLCLLPKPFCLFSFVTEGDSSISARYLLVLHSSYDVSIRFS